MTNKRVRKEARSASRRCKPGAFPDQDSASRYIVRLSEREPLKALGMRPYWCGTCKAYHVGRARSR